MWHGAKVAVVIPAYQEERIIPRTLRKLPAYVDCVYVVDDGSTDATVERAQSCRDGRIRLIRHERNCGVGAAIRTGYAAALAEGADLLAVLAADDQMDVAELPQLLDAVWSGASDYAKGNRFVHAEAARMPAWRRLGSQLLSALTRCATGLDVDDCQCGFTVLSAVAARQLPLDELWSRYGYPNDLLGMLAAAGCRTVEVPVRPIYADEQSGLRTYHALIVMLVIGRRWWRTRAARDARLRLPILPDPDRGSARRAP
jgi:dolichol-phosphate mannosyltransferase